MITIPNLFLIFRQLYYEFNYQYFTNFLQLFMNPILYQN